MPRFVAPSSMVGATTIATDMSNINADWRILPNSPLVDAGDPNTTFITYLPETDMDGNPRIYNNIADIGAYECTQTTMSQTITWNQSLAAALGDTIKLTATASSGLPVSYSSSNESVAHISNDTLFVVGAGTSIIIASQAGNHLYLPASDVSQTINISAPMLSQTIAWNQNLNFNINDEPVELTAVASSSLPVSYTSSDENVATVSGNVLAFVGVGQAIITASQAGNENFNPAADVMRILNVFNNVDVSDAEIANVSVYPNPTEGEIHIESQVIIESVSIYNVYGQLISSDAVNGSLYTANISDKVDGVYVVRIMLRDGNTITQKVVKQQ